MNRKSLHSALVMTLIILISIGCSFLAGTSQPQAMGAIQILNYHVRGSDPFPGGQGLPDTREYGVCIIAYPQVAGTIKPAFDTILAKDGLPVVEQQQTTYALPAGSYTLQEWQFDSEITEDPLYSAAVRTLVRPPEKIILNADETIVFGSERGLEAPGDFAEGSLGNPNCAGASQSQGMGTIEIVNDHVRGSDRFPGGQKLPDTREYGICILAYPPASGITKPTFDTLLAKDEEQTSWSLPAGTYTLQEWQWDGEINQDPLSPGAMRTLVRPPESIALGGNQTMVFGSTRTFPAPGDFVEGYITNPDCQGVAHQPGGVPPPPPPITVTPEITITTTAESGSATGVWVLKKVEPNLAKIEVQFSYPGLACNGGANATSTETGSTIATAGTCQVGGATVANETAQYSWTRPPEQLTPGEELTVTLTATSSGLCSWQGRTEDDCRKSVTLRHTVWQGSGLMYDSGNQGESAYAIERPASTVTWTVPDGSYGSGTTLVLQFVSHASQGEVTTNFTYEWQGP